jgi:galactokinase
MAIISAHFFSNNAYFDKIRQEIYRGNAAHVEQRYQNLLKLHADTFGVSEADFYSSPGRIEIVGNHTDHNGGKVLAAAITVDTLACVTKRGDGVINIKSKGYSLLRANVNDCAFSMAEIGTSAALIKGVVDYYNRSGKKTGGFCATMDSSVPKGSGVSSSSSFELAVAEILNVLYNGGELDPVFKAKASQYAENVYFGKPCGLMDQTSIALGGVNLIDFESFDNPEIRGAEWGFDDLDIYVVATGGDHSDLTDDYAAIPAEMKQAAKFFGKKLLREVPKELFESETDILRGKVSERTFLRAQHFFEENERVERAFAAVKARDKQTFLACVNASGDSSRTKLQNTYSQKAGNKNIENALDFVQTVDGVAARRVHGGGFAGTILLFADKAKSEAVQSVLDAEFGGKNVFKLGIRQSGAVRLAL